MKLCRAGLHDMEENPAFTASGTMRCRQCRNERNRRSHRRQRALIARAKREQQKLDRLRAEREASGALDEESEPVRAFEPMPAWMEQAECQHVDPDLFYPEMGPEGLLDYHRQVKQAKWICNNRCPVRAECLSYAVEHDEKYGIWGGLTEGERSRRKLFLAV